MDQAAIGRFIAKKRKERNLTQEQLSQKLGVSNKTISKWETGKCMPDYSVTELLCRELDITLAELMDGKEAEKDIHANDGRQALEILEKMQELRKKKILLMGVVFLLAGIVMLVLSLVIGGTQIQDTLSGITLGVAVPQLALGIFLVVHSLAKRMKK